MKKVTIKRGEKLSVQIDAPESYKDLVETCQNISQTNELQIFDLTDVEIKNEEMYVAAIAQQDVQFNIHDEQLEKENQEIKKNQARELLAGHIKNLDECIQEKTNVVEDFTQKVNSAKEEKREKDEFLARRWESLYAEEKEALIQMREMVEQCMADVNNDFEM